MSHGKTSSFQNPTKLGKEGKIVNKRQDLFNISLICKAIENNMVVLPVTTGCWECLGAVIITSLYNFGCIYRLDLSTIGIFTGFVGKYRNTF